MDICGPFLLDTGDKVFIIVMIDYHSKWPEVSVVRDVRSGAVIEFCEEVWRREGYPEAVVTDNGPQFTSAEFGDYMKKCGIKHIRTAVAHPRENGLVERFNRVISENIQLSVQNGLNWKKEIKNLLWNYRTTPHSLTLETPFMLLKGRKPCTKAVPGWMGKAGREKVNEEEMLKRVRVGQKAYDGRNKGSWKKLEKLKIGDWVRTKVWNKKKGESKWSMPRQVVSVKGYSVEMEDGKRWNVSEVTKCNEAELRKWKSMRDDNKWTEVNNEDKGGRCVGYWNVLLPSDVEKKLEC
ncbi:hypothetical protein NDU88_004841 [Pleurodeles waltl]|uniref:Integrase catalytic domain-containing protein n=1 Tax=Pleurodeles waltl TaxID=8319 RepID=A0AAV7RJA9_PLEWA|nr:hypothetical protein NDU88_004841 [Pleurodeles waltl]